MKYIVVDVAHRDGERKYYKTHLLTTKSKKKTLNEVARDYFKNYYAEGTEQDKFDKDVFWSKTGEVCLEILSAKEVTKAEFEILSKHLS